MKREKLWGKLRFQIIANNEDFIIINCKEYNSVSHGYKCRLMTCYRRRDTLGGNCPILSVQHGVLGEIFCLIVSVEKDNAT